MTIQDVATAREYREAWRGQRGEARYLRIAAEGQERSVYICREYGHAVEAERHTDAARYLRDELAALDGEGT
jgi:predicted RNA-binding protein YlxR (DUF448 family)